MGCHAGTGEVLLAATGASGRRVEIPAGARAVPRRGPADELLSLAEAAYLAGVLPTYLRRLAERQGDAGSATAADGRTGQAEPVIEGKDGTVRPARAEAFLEAEKDRCSGEWRVT